MVSWVGSLREVRVVVVALGKGEEAQSLSEGGDWRMTGMGGALGCRVMDGSGIMPPSDYLSIYLYNF